MNAKQYRHASRILRTNGMAYASVFFRSYPERLEVLRRLDAQSRDRLDDRAYMKSLNA